VHRDHRQVATAQPEDPATEIVELLHGLAAILMSIDARLERIADVLGGGDGEEDQP
jgi:hypothetical protein